MTRLTIAIPSYNRPEFLEKTLGILAPQSHPEAEIIIVDNCSEPPLADLVGKVLGGTDWKYRCEVNPINVGMGGNLLRCFEKGSGDFLWLLSDDDHINERSVGILMNQITENPKLDFGVFQLSVLPPLKVGVFHSLDSFLLNLDSSAPVIFISSALFRRERLLPYLHKAYEFIDSGAPHSALVLHAGNNLADFECHCLDHTIVEWAPPPVEERYSSFTPIGQTKLAMLLSPQVRAHFSSLLRAVCPTPARLLVHLLRDVCEGKPRGRSHRLLREYIHSYSNVSKPMGAFFLRSGLLPLGHLLLMFPSISFQVILTVSSLLKRPIRFDQTPVNLWDYSRLKEAAPSDH